MKDEKNIKRTAGFEVPEGYFESFEEQLNLRMQLDRFKIKDGLKSPQNYLESFEVNLEKGEKEVKVIDLWYRDSRFVSSALAAVAAALIAFLFIWNPSPQENTFENLSSTSLNEYLSDEGILDHITEEDLTTIENNNTIFDPNVVSDELLFEMIDDQMMDVELASELENKE